MHPILFRIILLLTVGAGLALVCALYSALSLVADETQPRIFTLPAFGFVLAFATGLAIIVVRTDLAIRHAHTASSAP